MSDQEARLQKGKLIEDFVAAKAKHRILQEEARREAKSLEQIVEFLRRGGERAIVMGVPPETYLSERIAKLVNELSDSIREMNALKAALDGIGISPSSLS